MKKSWCFFSPPDSFSLEDVTSPDAVETIPEEQNTPKKTYEEGITVQTQAVKNLFSDIKTKHSPVVVDRVLKKFLEETGLDDGVIDAGDDIAEKDVVRTETTTDKNSTETTTAIEIDGVIDQVEYDKYVTEFSNGIADVMTGINDEPFFEDEAEACASALSEKAVDGLNENSFLGDNPEKNKAAVRKMISQDIKNGVYT